MKKTENNKGITIVALSVTIIVLLILAGVSINAIVGENGLKTTAEEIRSNIEKAEYEGQTKINNLKQEEYTEDGANNLEDTEAPIINSMNIVNKTKTSFTVKVNITETGSGIDKVEYSIDDGESYVISGTKETEYACTFENLRVGFEEYKVKVKATDLCNNTSYADETVEAIKVGDYVNYTYDTASDYTISKSYSGYGSDQTIPQTVGLRWRVLKIHPDESLELISEGVSNKLFYLKGAVGYNNGVYLINDICEKQYSNQQLKVTARSLNMDDIEDSMNETGKTVRNNSKGNAGIKYGSSMSYTTYGRKYPSLYAQENGSGINTTTVKEDGAKRSDKYYSSPTTSSYEGAQTLTMSQSYILWGGTSSINYFDNSTLHSMFYGIETNYWIASRAIECQKNNATFGIYHTVKDGSMYAFLLFDSDNINTSNNNYLRPVVYLEADTVDVTIGKNENGEWQIQY